MTEAPVQTTEQLGLKVSPGSREHALELFKPENSPVLRTNNQTMPNLGILGSGNHASVISTNYHHEYVAAVGVPEAEPMVTGYDRNAAIKVMPLDVHTQAQELRRTVAQDPQILRDYMQQRYTARIIGGLQERTRIGKLDPVISGAISVEQLALAEANTVGDLVSLAQANVFNRIATERASAIVAERFDEVRAQQMRNYLIERLVPAGFVAEHACAMRSFQKTTKYVPDVFPEPILVELLDDNGEVTAEMPAVIYKKVEGVSLRDNVPKTLAAAKTVMTQIAEGFDILLQNGIFNHDPGPHNVLVEYDRVSDEGGIWIGDEQNNAIEIGVTGEPMRYTDNKVKIRRASGDIVTGNLSYDKGVIVTDDAGNIVYKQDLGFDNQAGLKYEFTDELSCIKLIDFGLASFVDEHGKMHLLEADFVISSANTFNPVCARGIGEHTTIDDLTRRNHYTAMGMTLHALGLPPIIDFDPSANWKTESSRTDLLSGRSISQIIINGSSADGFNFPPLEEYLDSDSPVMAGISPEQRSALYEFVKAYAEKYFDIYFFQKEGKLPADYADSAAIVRNVFAILEGKAA